MIECPECGRSNGSHHQDCPWPNSDKWGTCYACPQCYGPLTEKIVGTAADNVAAEIDYICPVHGLQAFWAYGHFDPNYPVLEIFKAP